MALLLHFVTLTVAVALTAAISPGIEITGGPLTWFGVALVFAVVNTVLGTVLRFLTLPLTLLTLGLFAFIVNGAMLLVTDALLESFAVDDLWSAIIGSVLISLVTALLLALVDRRREDPAGP